MKFYKFESSAKEVGSLLSGSSNVQAGNTKKVNESIFEDRVRDFSRRIMKRVHAIKIDGERGEI